MPRYVLVCAGAPMQLYADARTPLVLSGDSTIASARDLSYPETDVD